jgi:uncharacterized integral membrane protein (TIGR00698 family)
MFVKNQLLPGVAFCAVLGFASYIVGRTWLSSIGGVTLGLLVGLIFSARVSEYDKLSKGIDFVSKFLLNIAIVFLGITIDINKLYSVSFTQIFAVFIMVILTLVFSLFIARFLKIEKSLAFLIGIGSSICGTAAIIATSSLVTKKEEDIGTSIGVIQSIGIISLLSLPFIISLNSEFSSDMGAFLIGGSLQAVGHVVAASYWLGASSGKLAIAIKMARVCLLVPLMFSLIAWNASKNGDSFTKAKVPLYIYGFIFSVFLGSSGWLPEALVKQVHGVIQVILSVSMVSIGLKIKIQKIFHTAGKGFLLGVVLFVSQVLFLYMFI